MKQNFFLTTVFVLVFVASGFAQLKEYRSPKNTNKQGGDLNHPANKSYIVVFNLERTLIYNLDGQEIKTVPNGLVGKEIKESAKDEQEAKTKATKDCMDLIKKDEFVRTESMPDPRDSKKSKVCKVYNRYAMKDIQGIRPL